MREGWSKLKIKDICTKGSSNIAQNKIEGLSGDYAVYGASGYVQNVDFYHQEKPYICNPVLFSTSLISGFRHSGFP